LKNNSDSCFDKRYLVYIKIDQVNKPKVIILLIAVVVNTPAFFMVPLKEQDE